MVNHTACFTGHRPDKLYGYDLSNSNYQVLAHKLARIILDLYLNYNIDTFISGGALGVDTVAFFSVHYLKNKGYPLKNILAIPFKGQQNRWKPKDIERYNRMLTVADDIIYVDTVSGYNNSYSIGQKLNTRNHYMVDNSKYVIAVYDGSSSGGTYNCIQYAKKYNKEIVYVGI